MERAHFRIRAAGHLVSELPRAKAHNFGSTSSSSQSPEVWRQACLSPGLPTWLISSLTSPCSQVLPPLIPEGAEHPRECLRCGKHRTRSGTKNHCSQHLSCTLCAPGTLGTSCGMPHRTPQQPISFHSYFTDEETEAQRGQMTYPWPHSLQVAKVGFEYKQPDA